jgi:hypothetical protein
VLEKWGWDSEVLDYRAKSELHAAAAGLRVLTRRFKIVLVLVVVLVLDYLRTECWSTGVSAYCALSELHLTTANGRQ